VPVGGVGKNNGEELSNTFYSLEIDYRVVFRDTAGGRFMDVSAARFKKLGFVDVESNKSCRIIDKAPNLSQFPCFQLLTCLSARHSLL